MEYREFSNTIKKTRQSKQAKIRNSFGVYDVYKQIRKNKWFDIGRPLKENEFYSIIREVNNLLAEEISKGNEVTFPSRMGKLELRKIKTGVKIVNGKLINTYPINWEDTIRLWYEDEEARNKNIRLRNEVDCIYHVKYNKFDATYENKCFYEFSLNRFIKIALKENINKGKIDVLW